MPDESVWGYVMHRREGAHEDDDSKYTSCRVRVSDGRPDMQRFKLHEVGFELLSLDEPLVDAFLHAEDMQRYIYPVVAGYVSRATGAGAAGRVHVYAHVIRGGLELHRKKEGDTWINDPISAPRVTTPLYYVHTDFNEVGGPRQVRQLLEPYCQDADVEQVLRGRCGIVNLWYPLTPVTKDPLGLVSWASVQPEDFVDRGFFYDVRRNPNHKWFYFSGMDNDEALVFKTFESDTLEGLARFIPHASFQLEDEPPFAVTRQSIEFRCLVLYDAASVEFLPGF